MTGEVSYSSYGRLCRGEERAHTGHGHIFQPFSTWWLLPLGPIMLRFSGSGSNRDLVPPLF